MLTTSPYSQNDYTSVQLRKPYQLPTQEIANTVMAMNQYWQQGASRIKAAEQQALGLNLTLDTNKEYSKNFLDETKKKINSMVGMDLGDTDVQKQALGLFKPLFENKAILLDDTISKQRNNIIAEAQSYKNKDKGVGYAEENIIDALDKFSDFNGKTDPNSLEAIYEKTKNARYTPYYDVSKEMITLRDKCGEISTMSPSGGYDQTISGTPSEKIRGCLDRLSSQAITQLGISGRVRYGKDYKGLGQDLLQMNYDLQKRIGEQRVKNSAALTAKKIGDRDLGAEEINAISEENSVLERRMAEIKAQNLKIEQGDFSEVQQNYDTYAGLAFKNKTVDSFVNSFYTQDREYSANPFAVMAQKQMDAKELIDYKAASDAAVKKAEQEALLIPRKELGLAEEKIDGRSYEGLQEDIQLATNQYTSTVSKLFADLKQRAGDDPVINRIMKSISIGVDRNRDGSIDDTEAKLISEFLSSYYVSAQGSKEAMDVFRPYYKQLQKITSDRDNMQALMTEADLITIPDLKNKESELKKSFSPIEIEGKIITGDRFFNIVTGIDNEYKLSNNIGNKDFIGDGYSDIKRKSDNVTVSSAGPQRLRYNNFIKNYKEEIEIHHKKRNEFLQEKTAQQFNRFMINDNPMTMPLKKDILVAAGVSSTGKDEDVNKNINLLPSFMDGTIRFQFVDVDPKNVEAFMKKANQGLLEMYGGKVTLKDEARQIFEITNMENFNLIGDTNSVDLVRQRMKIAKNTGKESVDLYTNMSSINQHLKLTYNTGSDKIYIMDADKGTVIQTFPVSGIVDAMTSFNTMTK